MDLSRGLLWEDSLFNYLFIPGLYLWYSGAVGPLYCVTVSRCNGVWCLVWSFFGFIVWSVRQMSFRQWAQKKWTLAFVRWNNIKTWIDLGWVPHWKKTILGCPHACYLVFWFFIFIVWSVRQMHFSHGSHYKKVCMRYPLILFKSLL